MNRFSNGSKCMWVSTPPACVNPSIAQGRSYSNQNVDITGCLFVRSAVFSGDGGVIYLYQNYNLKVVNSVFYNCSTTQSGGVIFHYALNVELSRICVYSCRASNNQFATVFVFTSTSTYELITVASCGSSESGERCFNVFAAKIKHLNSSLNQALTKSSLSLSFLSNVNFSTFANNEAGNEICIEIDGDSTFLYVNFIHNKSPTKGVFFIVSGNSNCDSGVIYGNSDFFGIHF